jgi:23S rRNA (guanine745-N1)-methyltransferase
VPSAVPRSLACVAGWLRCPVCSEPLAPAVGALICSRGHSYDVAREGYVTLFATGVGHADGDDAGMVSARANVEQTGQFDPLTAALAETAGALGDAGTSLVLDVGAGTGHHLAGVLAALPQTRGVALDASRPAARSAARAHESIAAVRADVWRQIPLCDHSVDVALNVFAPRNGPELGRVVRPGGTVLSVTPTSRHLHELAALHSVRIDPDKTTRLRRELGPWFKPISVRLITWTLQFTSEQAAAVLRMGPAARHLRPDFERRLAALGESIRVTAAARLRVFQRRAAK